MSERAPSAPAPKQADIVLEGGGVRGIGHVGALSVAEEIGYSWVNIAGTSAGAFVAALLAAGYNAQELYAIMKQIDFQRFARDRGLNGLVPVEIAHMLRHGGLHSGNYIERFIGEKLQARPKPIVTFKDLVLRPHEKKDSSYRYRLTVIASDITRGEMLRLPQDMLKYHIDPDEINVALAVRMSASIPFFFIPISQKDKDGEEHLIVDGGLLSNFPVSLFDTHPPVRPTFGLRLVDSLPTPDHPWPVNPTGNVLEISKALLHTMLSAHDRLYMDDHTYVRTIAIPVDGISSIKFNLQPDEAEKLYQNGRRAAEQFFATWDFQAYTATFRCQARQGRRERLHEHMRRVRQTVQGTQTTELKTS